MSKRHLLSLVAGATILLLGCSEIHAQVGSTILGGGGKTPPASCGDSGHALGSNSSKNFFCQAITGVAAAGGSNTQIQFNNATGLSGAAGLTTSDLGATLLFSDGALKLTGATSGTAIIKGPATGGGTFTLPVSASDTIATLAATQTFTNKSISGSTNTVTNIPLSAFTNLGTTTTVLHGNAAGNPTFGAVSLTAEVTGTLPLGNGGTGVTAAQGNGTKVQLSTGTTTPNNCVKFDANGNTVDAGAACGGSGGTPANPTATAGPAAVNGVATTYMRSDAAPAIQLGTNAVQGIIEGDTNTISCVTGVCSTTGQVVAGTTQTATAAQWAGWSNFVVTTASQTITLPVSTSLGANGGFTIQTIGQSVTLAPNAADAINGGTSGASIVLPAGITATVTTDHVSAIRVSPTAAGTSTIASGTSAMGTSAISSGACATVVTTTATGTATTDVVTAGFNGDPTAVTGYIPATAGMLTIISYPTANNVNFKVCNNTSSSITPGALTLNWRVVR